MLRRVRPARNEPLYGPPGHAYVYLNYGIHCLVNVVTEAQGSPAAVLIRALEPLDGVDVMRRRRRRSLKGRPAASIATLPDQGLCRGPGNLTMAMGITLAENRLDLLGDRLFIEDRGPRDGRLAWGPSIGISVGTERAWRVYRGGTSGRLRIHKGHKGYAQRIQRTHPLSIQPVRDQRRLPVTKLDAVVDALDRGFQRAGCGRQAVRREERADVVSGAGVAERAERSSQIRVAEGDPQLRLEVRPVLLQEHPGAVARGGVARKTAPDTGRCPGFSCASIAPPAARARSARDRGSWEAH